MIYEKPENRNKLRHIISTGIWEDADGNPHFSLPDLLKMVDLEDTAENRKILTAMLHEVIAEHMPDATIIDRETTDD